ncbi:MAG: alternative ribosome rescue aminoacyl-tRNA hydrolase ArfB [Nitrospira sp.]|nr:alternative ribosome rescue aminoacyl-tRNA hydrolase ArfB [Nitrospira sp.]MDE0403815.1 alternative ribosome rescue aminoacyl-tRNA hydrolase ArfB [Nitrospira sp.]MDE0487190.1 alternative ribosome rescue aminoacyl-tRNA hydrolase ArfB [Nitrospira sp.]
MIVVTPQLVIPEQELRFRASRSSGPGGQNVNKVNTRVTLHFDVRRSPSLTASQKSVISRKLQTRINKEGVLYLHAQRAASQALNRADLVDKLRRLLREALAPQKVRKETRVSQRSIEERLDQKKQRGRVKQLRHQPIRVDD